MHTLYTCKSVADWLWVKESVKYITYNSYAISVVSSFNIKYIKVYIKFYLKCKKSVSLKMREILMLLKIKKRWMLLKVKERYKLLII